MQVIVESVLIPDSESRIKNGREGYGRRRWRKPRPPSPGISRRSEEADLIIDKGKWEVGMSKRAKLRLQEKLVFAGAAAAVALVGAAPAYAQSSDNQETSSIPEGQRDSQDIVVTAQKRASRLADVPAAISAFSGAYIEERGVSDFEGIVEQTPGVSITSDFGGSASKVISVRGLGGSDDYRPNGRDRKSTRLNYSH